VPTTLPPLVRNAALLGAAGGLRTAMPWAALAARGRLGHGPRRWAPIASAGGELVADKLPRTPSRTTPPGLAGRLVGGAFAGRLLARASGADAHGAAVCALIASGAACGSAFAGERTRAALGRRTGLPDPVFAVAEDAIAVGVALAATRRLARGSRSRARRGYAAGAAPAVGWPSPSAVAASSTASGARPPVIHTLATT
jgi:uncharacterized membrane protein